MLPGRVYVLVLEEDSELFTAERVLDWLSEALLLSVKTAFVVDDLRSALTLLLFSALPSRTPELELFLRVACELSSAVRFTSPFLLLLVAVPSARAAVVDVRRDSLSP